MALLSTQPISPAGTVVALVPAGAGGDQVLAGGGVDLVVKNADSGSHVVTLATPGTVDGLAIADRIVTVAAGTTVYIPVRAVYRDPETGLASVTYDAVTSLTVGVIRTATS